MRVNHRLGRMNPHEIELSEYGEASSVPSPVNRMMTAFTLGFRDGIDINLGVGYVNEATIPHDLIEVAYREVVAHPEKYRAPLNYGGPKGSPNLLESLRRFYVEHRIGGLDEATLRGQEVIVGPSGATSLLEGLTHVLPPGIVVTSDPMYYIYCDYLERRGFDIVAVPEDDDGIRSDLLREQLNALGDRKMDVRFLYVLVVGNPTSTILSPERTRDVVKIATELSREVGRGVPLFFDKAYADLIHDPASEPYSSGLLYDESGIVYEIGTLSKVLAPGLRVGYMIGEGGDFIEAMAQRTSDVGFSAPLINQEIASYLLDHHVGEQMASVNGEYRKKAEAVRAWVDRYLGEFVTDCRGGRAGFYFYLTLAGIETHEASQFFKFLARTTGDAATDGPADVRHPRIIYIPGEHCVHADGELVDVGRRQLRISYGFEELERIEAALKLMREAAIACEPRATR